jgi:pimeloyl-ACP methyl ester carboxylesterase
MQTAHDPDLPPALQSLLAAYPLHSVRLPGGAGQIGLRQASPVVVAAAVAAAVTAAAPPPLPLVLLHGIGSASASWLWQLQHFGRERLVLAWDAPGYGVSTALSMAEPLAGDYADALEQLLDALGIGPCILVGHSLGALMAAAFAARHPHQVQRLVLLSPAAGYGLATAAQREEKLQARLALMQRLGPQGLAAERSGNLLSPAAGAEARALVRWNMAQLDAHGHAQAAQMLASGRLIEDVARYRGPLLVACGSADTVTPEPGCRAIAAAALQGEYRSLPGLGHACYAEDPLRVNALLATQIPPAPGSEH